VTANVESDSRATDHIRHDVAERVRLDDRHDSHGRVSLDLGDDLVDVVLVVRDAAVGNRELSVRRVGSTVTVRKVVHDNLEDRVRGRRAGKVRRERGDLRDGVEPVIRR
jgi:hypothetical protein